MRPLSDLLGDFLDSCETFSTVRQNVELKNLWGGIDRTILEALSDLMHLLRNAFDHGIEDPATRRSW